MIKLHQTIIISPHDTGRFYKSRCCQTEEVAPITWTPDQPPVFFGRFFLGKSPVWDGDYWRFSRLLVFLGNFRGMGFAYRIKTSNYGLIMDSLGYWYPLVN
jgi:hypothetical protein